MSIFSRRPSYSMPPLHEPIKAGQTIQFDEDEQTAITRETRRTQAEMQRNFKDSIFSEDMAGKISNAAGELCVQSALRYVAEHRLLARDFQGAAATCIKLIGMTGGRDIDWLLFAKIHAEYGDIARAQGMLKEAVKLNKKRPWLTGEVWEYSLREVETIIKRNKKT